LSSDISHISYSAGHHNWCQNFVFEPHLEPGLDQCTLNQLQARDIRRIYLSNVTYCGSPSITTSGFPGDPFYLGDFIPDYFINQWDLAMFAERWLDSDCGRCGEIDLDCDSDVDFKDFADFAKGWLQLTGL
jgi:hypothetical protein